MFRKALQAGRGDAGHPEDLHFRPFPSSSPKRNAGHARSCQLRCGVGGCPAPGAQAPARRSEDCPQAVPGFIEGGLLATPCRVKIERPGWGREASNLREILLGMYDSAGSLNLPFAAACSQTVTPVPAICGVANDGQNLCSSKFPRHRRFQMQSLLLNYPGAA